MKRQKRMGRGLYLQRRNNRWKWMAGATAATATGVTTAQAGLVTINLTGNFISAHGGNHLNADLTGDGQPDLVISNAFHFTTYGGSPGDRAYAHYNAGVNLNGVLARAFFAVYDGVAFLQIGSHYKTSYYVLFASLKKSIPVSFTDPNINGGALTRGSLRVTVFGQNDEGQGEAEVQLNSLTFNTPEDGSSLGLLAMGAGGVLAFRRWRAGRERA